LSYEPVQSQRNGRESKKEELVTPPVSALVDTGSELTWLPADLLKSIGIAPRRERLFEMANKPVIRRPIVYGIVRAEGYETNDEIVFAEPGDMTLLGVRTLESFGVAVDNIGKRFLAAPTLVVSVRLA
jgi:predicted aspartyl protease